MKVSVSYDKPVKAPIAKGQTIGKLVVTVPGMSPTEFPPLDATVIIKALSVGLDLSSLPLTSKLKPSSIHITTPYAITNPIWIDVDGNGWTPLRPPLPAPGASARRSPDVRAQFEALPEVSP